MKSCATGLSVRFFRVTIPFGTRRHRQLDWQDHDLRLLGGKSQRGGRKDREKAPGRHKTDPCLGRNSDHSCARMVEAAGAKAFHDSRPQHSVRRGQYPGLIRQLGKRELAPSGQRMLNPRHDDKQIIKEKFEAQTLVRDGTDFPGNQEIEIALVKVAMNGFNRR